MDKKGRPRTFRPWPENDARLAFAERLDLNVSELVNEVLKQHLKPALEQKARKIRELMSQPVP